MSAHFRAAIAALRAELARCMQGEDYERAGFTADGGLAVLATLVEDWATGTAGSPMPCVAHAPAVPAHAGVAPWSASWWQQHVGRMARSNDGQLWLIDNVSARLDEPPMLQVVRIFEREALSWRCDCEAAKALRLVPCQEAAA